MSDSNHSTDIGTIAYMSGVAKGREDERAKIVAWLLNLKEMSDCYVDHIEAGEIAAYITRGEHLK